MNALEYVRTLFGIPKDRCIAAGDSGNDILMLAGTSPHSLLPLLSTVLIRRPTQKRTQQLQSSEIFGFERYFLLAYIALACR